MSKVIQNFSLPIYTNNIPKYQHLWNKYKEVYISMDTGSEMFFEGLVDISKYIEGSFYFLINSNYKDRNNIEKIIIAIYNRIKDDIDIKHEISDTAERSLLLALGLEGEIESYKWNKNSIDYSNLIKHTIKKVFIPELLKLFKGKVIEVSESDESDDNLEDIESEILKIDFISDNIKTKLINYLEGSVEIEELTDMDKNILEMVYNRIS